jgi:uncharacterized protein DUF6527
VKLVELNPKFLASYGVEGQRTEGMGVDFDCPCGNHSKDHRLYVPFENRIGPGPLASTTDAKGWKRTGETFEKLTLTPSIQRTEGVADDGIGCRWHGFITNGEVITV